MPNSELTINVHYASRGWDTFVQPDPAKAHAVLETVTPPSRLFSQKTLMLADTHRVIAIVSDKIARIEFVGSGVPTWPYLQSAELVQEVTQEQFAQRFDPPGYREMRRHAWSNPTTAQYGFTELLLSDGTYHVWEVVMQSRTMLDADVQPFIHGLLSTNGLHARNVDDTGVVVVNPEHILRIAFYPGPPELPAKTWQVESVSTG